MYETIEDFLKHWKTESESTIKIFSAIPESKKSEKVHDDVRTLERLAWHITQTVTEMPYSVGLFEDDPLDKKNIPESFEQITDTYKKYSDDLVSNLEQKWSSVDLNELIEIYGQKWKRKKILSVLIMHQTHHRAQMTVIMRILGIKVPGLYGPAKEEWKNFGMEVQE